MRTFKNRAEAGQLLAFRLAEYKKDPNTLILALPRGGVPVAYEIAHQLSLPLDICLVRKLGVPNRKELAMGAIGPNGIRVINESVVADLDLSSETIEQVTQSEKTELERRDRLYRGDRSLPEILGKTIILVDDGIATGATLKAAIFTLKPRDPACIIVAIPVAPPDTCEQLKEWVEGLICLVKPPALHSISVWYEDFSQTSDEEVCDLLARANHELMVS